MPRAVGNRVAGEVSRGSLRGLRAGPAPSPRFFCFCGPRSSRLPSRFSHFGTGSCHPFRPCLLSGLQSSALPINLFGRDRSRSILADLFPASPALRKVLGPKSPGRASRNSSLAWGVVQLVGHLTVNEDGGGSSPPAPANSENFLRLAVQFFSFQVPAPLIGHTPVKPLRIQLNLFTHRRSGREHRRKGRT